MLVRVKKSWETSEAAVTPERVYLNRRTLMRGMAGLIAGGGLAACGNEAETSPPSVPTAGTPQIDAPSLSFVHNDDYVAGRDVTAESITARFNNFYEYGSHKTIADAADAELRPRPWQIVIDGLVEKPIRLDVDELIARMTLEERIYRHRCVERWAMVVPWIGFPVKKLVAMARPLGSAKYLRMETFGDPALASGIRDQSGYPWPYIEGITIPEAQNDLPFLVVGAYGKVVPNAMGAPIRLHLPWKYGFKSIKSIVRFTFTEQRPVGFWEAVNASEYGFWANVNPEVPHPRWSQASEQLLGTDEVVPTTLFNGYAEVVAGLYDGVQDQMLFR